MDEAREALEAAQAELYAGDVTAEDRVERAQNKLDGLKAAYEQSAGGGGWGEEDDAAYEDEYDDAYDGLGYSEGNIAEGQTSDEAMRFLGHAAVRGNASRVSARRASGGKGGSAVVGEEEEREDESGEDDGDEDNPERGGGQWGADKGVREAGMSARVGQRGGGGGGFGRGLPAGGRGMGGGDGRREGLDRPSRGRGWGTANAKVARRKEENKGAIGNHHRYSSLSSAMILVNHGDWENPGMRILTVVESVLFQEGPCCQENAHGIWLRAAWLRGLLFGRRWTTIHGWG